MGARVESSLCHGGDGGVALSQSLMRKGRRLRLISTLMSHGSSAGTRIRGDAPEEAMALVRS